ncbi:GIY-YIG nuclease family protein [Mucilaginibacter psychrotolerans]|uniref:GIY-YIG nuclease family protein n=1 Tax=Mucilaginibacter psychrotolerans TaxID=1524096 RepID=A0A4Y8SDT4_9SPHI|nr:GIY-YIG nuclease family protein [Mucilaginibacter psychrotolerans]TFF37072.1 GIY-YIG nuclease family protein [Mucilaginibacter psychrotolerans]
MFLVYAISSLTRNYIYVGLSSDIERRISDHNNGYNKTTKPYKPFKTILLEEYPTRTEARHREKYLKSGVGKAYLKKLLSNDNVF